MLTPRHVRPLPTGELSTLTVKRLLAYKERVMSLEDTVAGSDWAPERLAALDPELIYFKEDPRWVALHEALKSELASREHVE